MARSLTVPKPPQADEPSPISLPDLRRKVIRAQITLGRLTRSGTGGAELIFARVDLVLSRLNTLRPVRVFQLYARRRGPLMAAGLAYRLFFAISALLVVGFAALGLVVSSNEPLQRVIIDAVDRTVPGLIDLGDGEGGLWTPAALFETTSGLGTTLVVSAALMVVTSLAWVNGMRQGMRAIFALDHVTESPILVRIRDLGTLALLAVVMVLTTALGVVANDTLGALLALLGLDGIDGILTQLASLTAMLVLDTLVAIVLLRSASAIEMPRRILLQGAGLAGIGSTVLRMFSAQLLESVSRNPLLLPFVVVLALFVWFFFLSQAYLIATAWCAVGTADAGERTERRHRAKAGTLRQQSRRKSRG